LKQARLVFKSAPDLAEAVLEGTKPLNDAYDEVRMRDGTAANELASLRSR